MTTRPAGARAIGCIAAAVAGEVEFGLPCVIGGAATSAALRFRDAEMSHASFTGRSATRSPY